MREMDSLTSVTIYTDGSCLGNPGPGGWAAILIHDRTGTIKEIYGGDKHTTNNRMEITAAIEALQKLKRPVKATIHTDSSYLLNAFTKGWIYNWKRKDWVKSDKKPVENIDLWKRLLELSNIHHIEWRHVKAHIGHKYNERCDTLAKQGAQEARNKVQ